MQWTTSRFAIDLRTPKIMGIVNVTPDSFSDGGQYGATSAAVRHCEKLIQDGADILDIGGESTRPGATPLSVDDELHRLLPVLREAVKFGVPVSIDTYKPQVMQVALDEGVDIINDVWALRWRPSNQKTATLRGPDVVAAHPACGICLMHMHREPLSMQVTPMEGDVPSQVTIFLQHAAVALQALGVVKSRIVVDPGIGFGKTVAQNFELLARQREVLTCGYPLVAGWSRKSSLVALLGDLPVNDNTAQAHPRMVASVAAALLAVERGASVVRVHDVRETAQALKVLQAIH
ncbi:dihydropteroate synthase [Rhodoferax sp. PAMC 29310]|uniref:dihydropteroate synthase n=1 Tax=Rhodoferax sp. PAMC 29310 TaxID=2822760 RepID=UPI001B336CA5|nr:dihydropteroate synthase [Rhodoferax sp. PAMC 29310]